MLEKRKIELVELHLELQKNNLVVWTGVNISARDPKTGLALIQSNDIRYEEMRTQPMVVDLEGKVVEGGYKPSSEVYSHLYIYNHRPDTPDEIPQEDVEKLHQRYRNVYGQYPNPLPSRRRPAF